MKGNERREEVKGERKKKEERGRGTASWKDAPILHGSQTHLQHIYYLTALQSCGSPWRAETEQRAGQEKTRNTESDGGRGDIKQPGTNDSRLPWRMRRPAPE